MPTDEAIDPILADRTLAVGVQAIMYLSCQVSHHGDRSREASAQQFHHVLGQSILLGSRKILLPLMTKGTRRGAGEFIDKGHSRDPVFGGESSDGEVEVGRIMLSESFLHC